MARLKVMLLTPPYHCGVVESAGTWMPLSLACIAGEARAAGAEVRLYDAMSLQHTHDDIAREMESFAPDIVGTGAYTALEPDAQEVCRTAKRINSDTLTVMGGVHPTFMWREVLERGPDVDVVALGEGEMVFADIVRAAAAGDDMSKVAGIAYRRDGVPTLTGNREAIADLDALRPAWDLLEWPIYSYRPSPEGRLAIVNSSRGCTSRCSFCSQQKFWGRTWRGRSAENFVSELEYLRDTHDVRVAMLSDETPTTDAARWEQILDLVVERGVGTEVLMETRVDHILRDESILAKYRAAGVSHIYVGVESGTQSDLDTMKKDTSVEQSRRAIGLINEHDMVSETSFVLGLPGETLDSINDTIGLAQHYAPDLAFFLAIAPWPYAEIYEELRPYIQTDDYRRYNLVESVVRTEALTCESLNSELLRATKEFYVDKMKRLGKLTPQKREFMLKVMRIMVEHSYLGDIMRSAGGEMPPQIREMMGSWRSRASNA